MVRIQSVQNGTLKFIDNELLPKMQGWKKWTFGAAASLWLTNLPNVFQKIKENSFVGSLGIIDESGMINIEKLYAEFYKQAERTPVTFDIPVIGQITLDKTDVEKLYAYIKEG
jgi:hypothetical protein